MQYMHTFGQMWIKHPCILHLFTDNYSESLNFVDIMIGCKENIVHVATSCFCKKFYPLPYTYGPHSLPSLRHENKVGNSRNDKMASLN